MGMAVYFEGAETERKVKVMKAAETERKVKVWEVALRCVALVLGATVVALTVSNKEVKEIISVQQTAKFTDLKAMLFLVIANGLVAAYSLVQLVRCVASLLQGEFILSSRPLALAIFVSDQIMAYVTLSAIAATMQAAVIAEYGQPEFQWMKTCNLFRQFCFQSGEGAAMAFLVSMASICLSGISAFNLFRLYDSSLI